MEHQDGSFESSLTEKPGIISPQTVNPRIDKFLRKRVVLSVDDYFAGIISGDRSILARAITLLESTAADDIQMAQALLNKCKSLNSQSVRIGITGAPGAGKSTLIEALGLEIVKRGEQLAVLAVDPSSYRTKGSILGDKTRMEELSKLQAAFVRPSPSSCSLGGVARMTKETIILCEAAGFKTIIVETVGVGQSEVVVREMVDFFLLVQVANTGDELQGIKRGIMEMADMIVVNKADGDNIEKCELAASQYKNALHFFMETESGWTVPVITCSAYSGKNMDAILDTVHEYVSFTKASGFFEANRQRNT